MRLLGAAIIILIIIGALVTLGVDGIIDLFITGYETVKNEIPTR